MFRGRVHGTPLNKKSPEKLLDEKFSVSYSKVISSLDVGD